MITFTEHIIVFSALFTHIYNWKGGEVDLNWYGSFCIEIIKKNIERWPKEASQESPTKVLKMGYLELYLWPLFSIAVLISF